MFQSPRVQKIALNSGQSCRLVPIRNDLIRNYYLLVFPVEQGQPSASEVTEMLNLGVGYAQALADQLLGDPMLSRFFTAATVPGEKRAGTCTSCCSVIAGKRHGCMQFWLVKTCCRLLV